MESDCDISFTSSLAKRCFSSNANVQAVLFIFRNSTYYSFHSIRLPKRRSIVLSSYLCQQQHNNKQHFQQHHFTLQDFSSSSIFASVTKWRDIISSNGITLNVCIGQEVLGQKCQACYEVHTQSSSENISNGRGVILWLTFSSMSSSSSSSGVKATTFNYCGRFAYVPLLYAHVVKKRGCAQIRSWVEDNHDDDEDRVSVPTACMHTELHG